MIRDPAACQFFRPPPDNAHPMKPTPATVIAAVFVLAAAPAGWSAQVDLARNSVRGNASARLSAGSSLGAGDAFATGRDARTQVSLGRNGSLVRAGSKTEATLRNETSLSLRQGILLASSGRGAFGREGVAIETPGSRATVKGTMLVAYQPQTYLKITCIEGEVTVRLKALLGEFVALREGQMVIINPAEKRLPESVEIHLAELIRTSALLGPEFPALSAAPRLDRAAGRQARVVGRGDVIATPLILTGAGLDVSLESDSGVGRQPERVPRPEPPADPGRGRAASPDNEGSGFRPPPHTGGGNGGNGGGNGNGGTGPEYIIDGATVFTFGDPPRLETPGFPVLNGATQGAEEPTIWSFYNMDEVRHPELLIRGHARIPAASDRGDAFIAAGVIQVGDGTATAVEHDGPLILSASGPITIEGANIANAGEFATSLTLVSAVSVRLADAAIEQRGEVHMSAPSVEVRQSRIGSAGQTTLSAAGGGAGITISNSSELHSLASGIGLALVSQSGPISVHDSQLTASEILIDAFNSSGNGVVELRNAVLNGDVIRARGYHTGGLDALIVNGSRVNATEMIKFYAEGASRLRFQGTVELNLSESGQAILAGRTVQVDEGGAVRVRGQARVFRDVDNYNKRGFGVLNASGQVIELPYDRRPPF